MLQWARNNGCPWDEKTCYYAGRNGHLQVFQWARNNGCAWDANTCAHAAVNGHLLTPDEGFTSLSAAVMLPKQAEVPNEG